MYDAEDQGFKITTKPFSEGELRFCYEASVSIPLSEC